MFILTFLLLDFFLLSLTMESNSLTGLLLEGALLILIALDFSLDLLILLTSKNDSIFEALPSHPSNTLSSSLKLLTGSSKILFVELLSRQLLLSFPDDFKFEDLSLRPLIPNKVWGYLLALPMG